MTLIVPPKRRDFRELLGLDPTTKGTVDPSTISVETRLWEPRKEIIKLQQTPMTLTDAGQGGSKLIATLPLGFVAILGAVLRNMTVTCTSILANTLNASVLIQTAVGTAAQSAASLSGTMQNLVATANGSAPATINTATAIASRAQSSAIAFFDGSVTPVPIYLNIAVPTATDIDGDATLLIDAEVEINYFLTAALLRND